LAKRNVSQSKVSWVISSLGRPKERPDEAGRPVQDVDAGPPAPLPAAAEPERPVQRDDPGGAGRVPRQVHQGRPGWPVPEGRRLTAFVRRRSFISPNGPG